MGSIQFQAAQPSSWFNCKPGTFDVLVKRFLRINLHGQLIVIMRNDRGIRLLWWWDGSFATVDPNQHECLDK